jgi:hypothetical protein
VFGAMLNKPDFQKFSNDNPMQQEVRVNDIEPDIFKIILKFLYTDNVNLDPDNVMAILYAGKYGVFRILICASSSEICHNIAGDSVYQLSED